MIYKFKSKAAADLIYNAEPGAQLLRLMGKEPDPQGIVEVEQMQAAIAALQEAIVRIEAQHAKAMQEAIQKGSRPTPKNPVGLRQRAQPLIQMLERSHKQQQPIVWGV